ncbi:MAG: hypothetical protein ACR2H2_03570 [Solirubrobacteraceae bacterium]
MFKHVSNPEYHRPGRPVCEGGRYAALTIDGRTLTVRYFPAGSTLTVMNGAHGWMLVGLTTACSY